MLKVIFVFVCYINVTVAKIIKFSKFSLATNSVMYVYILSDCIRDIQQSETIQEVNIKSNKNKSTMIIILLNLLHLHILFYLENMKIYSDTVG